jgi:hypothetical protein
VGHRVGIPWLVAGRVRGECERVFWDLDADGSRLGAAAPEPLLEELTSQQAERQDAAFSVLGRLLDVLAFLATLRSAQS